MTAIARRSIMAKIPASTTMCAADDLNGAATTLDVTGKQRVLIIQRNDGTAGTVGVDVVGVSHDGGTSWAVDDKLLALASDDATGTIVAGAALNAAGVEPTNSAIFKTGPFEGPTLLQVFRDGTNLSSAAWVTGAPSVIAITIG